MKSRGKTTMPIVFLFSLKRVIIHLATITLFLIYNSPKNISKNYWISSISSSNKLGKIVNEQFWFLWWHHFMPPSKYSERIVSSCQVWLLGGDGKFWHVSFASDLTGGAPLFQICKHTNGNGAYQIKGPGDPAQRLSPCPQVYVSQNSPSWFWSWPKSNILMWLWLYFRRVKKSPWRPMTSCLKAVNRLNSFTAITRQKTLLSRNCFLSLFVLSKLQDFLHFSSQLEKGLKKKHRKIAKSCPEHITLMSRCQVGCFY